MENTNVSWGQLSIPKAERLQEAPRFLLQCKPGASTGGTMTDERCGTQTHAEHSWEHTWFNASERFNFSHYFKHCSINRKCRNLGVQGTSLFSFSSASTLAFPTKLQAVIQTEIPLCTKLFPSLADIKGADTSGTSLPVLSDGQLTFIKAF